MDDAQAQQTNPLFGIIPKEFFTPLASPNRLVYWDCLCRLFQAMSAQLSFGIEREILVDELQFYFEQNQAAEFEEDDINGMDSRKKANEIVARLMAKNDERTAVYREYEQGSISLEQVEEYEHQYQVAVQKQEADFKKVMLAVNDIEKAFSHGNPWLMKFRAISIPETLERTHLKEWLDHVWIVDFEQVEVILQESEWKRFFPEEWLNNGEEDCNGKKE